MSTRTADYRDAVEHLPDGVTLVIPDFSLDDYEHLLDAVPVRKSICSTIRLSIAKIDRCHLRGGFLRGVALFLPFRRTKERQMTARAGTKAKVKNRRKLRGIRRDPAASSKQPQGREVEIWTREYVCLKASRSARDGIGECGRTRRVDDA